MQYDETGELRRGSDEESGHPGSPVVAPHREHRLHQDCLLRDRRREVLDWHRQQGVAARASAPAHSDDIRRPGIPASSDGWTDGGTTAIRVLDQHGRRHLGRLYAVWGMTRAWVIPHTPSSA